jgi:hypothetical protein
MPRERSSAELRCHGTGPIRRGRGRLAVALRSLKTSGRRVSRSIIFYLMPMALSILGQAFPSFLLRTRSRFRPRRISRAPRARQRSGYGMFSAGREACGTGDACCRRYPRLFPPCIPPVPRSVIPAVCSTGTPRYSLARRGRARPKRIPAQAADRLTCSDIAAIIPFAGSPAQARCDLGRRRQELRRLFAVGRNFAWIGRSAVE